MYRSSKKSAESAKKPLIEALAPVIPSMLWVGIASIALAVFYDPLTTLLKRATKLRVGGTLEIESQIERSRSLLPDDLLKNSTDPKAKALARRLSSLSQRERPYRVLVAHDVFEEARPIQSAFLELGFTPDIALCPVQIEQMLRQFAYDVVVSDVDWSKCEAKDNPRGENGIKFLDYAVKGRFDKPTVFFIRNYDPSKGTPPYAIGITNDWYDALHYVVDALSRLGPRE